MKNTHKIGIDYTEVIKQRKCKRDLPLVGRIKTNVDIRKIKAQVSELLVKYRCKIDAQNFSADPASTEHSYNLRNTKGELFVKNYEEVYRKYSVIGLQELSEEAKQFARNLSYSVSDLTPVQRLHGMTNTSSKFYHPFYDERNYTEKTEYCEGYIQEVLDMFQSASCRSALVVLYPGEFLSPHFDVGAEYITRLQIPIFTNAGATIGVKGPHGWEEFHLPADGGIYFINAGYEHYAINLGQEPRFQIRICLNGQDDLHGMEPVQSLRRLTPSEFAKMPFCDAQETADCVDQKALAEFNLK